MKIKELKDKIIIAELDPNAKYICLVASHNINQASIEHLVKSTQGFPIIYVSVRDVDRAIRFVEVPKNQHET